MDAPYAKQGEPLPRGMAPGVWVAENLVHLSFVDSHVAPPPPDWTVTYNLAMLNAAPAGSSSAGFSAERLARGLRVPLDELLRANRNGLLTVTVSHVGGESGDVLGIRFSFQYGIRCFEVVSCCGIGRRTRLERVERRARRSDVAAVERATAAAAA